MCDAISQACAACRGSGEGRALPQLRKNEAQKVQRSALDSRKSLNTAMRAVFFSSEG